MQMELDEALRLFDQLATQEQWMGHNRRRGGGGGVKSRNLIKQ
jgi:hypothetical protein